MDTCNEMKGINGMDINSSAHASAFSIHFIDINSTSIPVEDWQIIQYRTEQHSFIYVASGCIQYAFMEEKSSKLITVNSGEMIFIPQGTLCQHCADVPTELREIHFLLDNGDIPPYLAMPTLIYLPNINEFVENFFGANSFHSVNHPYYYKSCLYRLLWRLDECQNLIPRKYARIKPALRQISENLQDDTTVSQYAEMCQISETTFRRLFREYTGLSPVEYRNNLRMQSAKRMLMSGKYTVSEVAYACGFDNISFFSRSYKKKFGILPSDE